MDLLQLHDLPYLFREAHRYPLAPKLAFPLAQAPENFGYFFAHGHGPPLCGAGNPAGVVSRKAAGKIAGATQNPEEDIRTRRFSSGGMSYKKTLERADAFFAKVAAEQPQNLQCGRGCSFCCYGLFEIGAGDVAVIAEGLEQLHPMRRKRIIRRAQEILDAAGPRDDREAFFDRTDDVPCPNLDENGLCMMYEHRPMVCRTFGLPIRDGSEYIGDICELNFTEASQPEKERAAWDLQWEDVMAENELTIPEAIVIAARIRGWGG